MVAMRVRVQNVRDLLDAQRAQARLRHRKTRDAAGIDDDRLCVRS